MLVSHPLDAPATALAADFGLLAELVGLHAAAASDRPVIIESNQGLSYSEFNGLSNGIDAEEVRAAVNARLGKTQRLSALVAVDVLPRSAIGKVLKRELRDAWHG